MAYPAIPGLDVQYPVESPRAPGFTPGGSPAAKEWQQSLRTPTPAAPAAPTQDATLAQRAMRSLRGGAQAVSGGLRAAGGAIAGAGKASLPALAGSALGWMQQSTDANEERQPFVAPPASPGAIPIDSTLRAPAPVRSHPLGFGPDNEFTRNLANTINAIPGVNASPLRAGSLGGQAVTALRTGQQVVRGAQAGPDLPPPSAMPGTPAAPSASPNPTDLRLAASTQRAPVPDGAPAGPTITRTGNSFSDGSDPGALSRVSTIGNGGIAADLQQLANLRNLPGPELGGMGGFGHRGSTETFGPSLSVLGPSGSQRPRDLRHAAALANERAIASERMANDRGLATMREGGEMARANLSANTQRQLNERQIDATLRGQDITREGHMISAQGQRAQMLRDQFNKDREFVAGRADKGFEQRQGRESQLQKNIEAVTSDLDSDGKPVVNAKAAAEYRTGIDRSVARMGASGVHELSPMDEQRLMAGSDLLRTMRANAGWLPWQPDKLKTTDPLDLVGMRVLPNGDRQITRADSKAAGQIIPRRFFDTMEGARYFGGTPTSRYDILSEGK